MISISDADDHAGVLTTFFIAAYPGLSIAGVALGIALQQVSPHTTLLIFALIVGLGLLRHPRNGPLARRQLEAVRNSP